MATLLRRRTASHIAATTAESTAESTAEPAVDAVPKPLVVRPVMRRPLRTTSTNTAAHRAVIIATVRQELDHHLQALAKNEAALDAVMAEQEHLHATIEALLRSNNLSSHGDDNYIASIEEVWSRQSTFIDPKKYKNAVGNDAFFDSIEVKIGKAREYLASKEFAAVADITLGKPQGFKFFVRPRKKAK